MKRRGIYFLILYCVTGVSQNLVPNPSFEDYTACPIAIGSGSKIELSPPWHSPTWGTPDYFRECPGGGVPSSSVGNQYPRTGNAHAGIVTYWTVTDEYREYISTKLLLPLVSGKKNCVTFYHSKGDESSKGADGLGIYFSIDSIIPDSLTYWQARPLPFRPQIDNPPGNILMNDSDWVKLQGVYVARGGEKYIVIGNFHGNDSTQIKATSGSLGVAYYYIDDVSVFPIYDAAAGANQSICPGSGVSIGTNQPDSAQYAWSPGTGLSDSTSCCPVAAPDSTVTYTLTKYGMCDTTYSEVTVFVKECPPSDTALFIPNTITPNGDGANDTWVIAGLENYPGHWIKVFNRNGNLLWQSGNYDNTWDGAVEGKELPAGVYFYILELGGGKEALQGTISIIR